VKKKSLLLLIVVVLTVIGCSDAEKNKAVTLSEKNVALPLPSWNDGETKRAILSYVQKTTDTTSADFIPINDRLATFDNDGTLWAERPYVQELFAFYMVKKMVAKDPALAKKQPFRAVVENDKATLAKGGDKMLLQL